jgi:D-alanine-D-alanine ligase
MRIGLTYDLRDDYLALGWPEHLVAEFDRADTIEALECAIRAAGHRVERIGNAFRLMERLAAGERWDLVFNFAESVGGTGREALVPALLEAHGVPYTFGDPLACAVTLDKPTAKRILRDLGLPTPDFAVIERVEDLERVDLALPLFAKPAREGSSMGVGPDSLVRDRADLRPLVERLLERFRQPVLVERFLPGREVTVGLVGTGERAEVVAVLEVVLREGAEADVYTYENKERCEELVEYRLATDAFAEACAALARRAYIGLGCRDAGRVDLRADERGRPQVIELNPLSGLHPLHSDLPIMATLAGWSYEALIARILASASERCGAVACA